MVAEGESPDWRRRYSRRVRHERSSSRIDRVRQVDSLSEELVGWVTDPEAVVSEDPSGYVVDRTVRIDGRSWVEKIHGSSRLVDERLGSMTTLPLTSHIVRVPV